MEKIDLSELLEEHNKEIRNKLIDEILEWCFNNSFVDYTEEYSYNGDCLIVFSKLKNYLEEMKV